VTTAKVDLTGDGRMNVYQDITYLMPFRAAADSIKLDSRMASKVLIACPGFPRDSFYYYAFDGRFEGGFNRLYLVVDRADQVVCVQLVEEATKAKTDVWRDLGWHCYDFVNARTKATNRLVIGQKIALSTLNIWNECHDVTKFAPAITKANTNWKVARVDTVLTQPDPKYPTSLGGMTTKQTTRWYVPRPIVELILSCVQQPAH
jgi:hypothetical protein